MMRSKINIRKQIGKARVTQTRVKRRLLVETLCDRRVLATITGMVFDDVNESWRPDVQETSLAGRLVFVDANDNGLPEDGERFALTDVDGSFFLEELGSDDQIVRLFSGSASQQQHFPVHPDGGTDLIGLSDFAAAGTADNLLIDPAGGRAVVLASGGMFIADLAARTTIRVELGATPAAGAFLADGRILVLASDESGNHAFLVASDGVVAPVNLFTPPAGDGDQGEGEVPEGFSGWAAVAIANDGKGVLIAESGNEPEPLLARKLVVDGGSVSSVETVTAVVPGARLIGGDAVTTVIAEPIEGGLALSLWSNSTGTVISDEPVAIAGVESIIAYSDATGLVFAFLPPQGDASSGAVVVLDAAADFAVIQTITDLEDLIAVDTARSVVFSLSTEKSGLRAIDALTAETVADWMVDLGLAGKPVEIALHAAGKELVLLGSAGLATISLDRVDAHRVKLDGSVPQYPLRFSVKVSGENEPPVATQPLEFSVVQGTPLVVPAGGLLAGAVDPDGDPFVVVRSSSPQHGVATITPLGGMTYTADPGFVGTDTFEVFLHDGRGPSSPVTVQITVSPLVPPEPEVVITILPVPENVEPGFVVGHVETLGFGGGPLIFVIDDQRFVVINNLIVVVPGAVLNFEDEFLINTTLTVTDEETEQTVARDFTVELSDQDDPIEDIQPRAATIFENVVGELIAELMVIDQDAEQPFILTVDDDRFEIVNRNLRLKPGVSLDFEAASEVVINITASDASGGGDSLTVPFTLTVIDVPERASSIALSDTTIIELVRGATVGEVIIDGNPLRDNYVASVDDSRFEIVAGILKLRDDEFLSRNDQQEAQLIITVQDVGQAFAAVAETFVIVVLENENPFFNADSPFDVNADGLVTPLDALLILNALSRNGGGGPISQFPPPGQFWDVNGDGLITPLDALLILNFINQQNRNPPVSEPEGPDAPLSQDQPIAVSPASGSALEPTDRSALPQRVSSLDSEVNPLFEPLRDADLKRIAPLAAAGERVQPALISPQAATRFDRALESLDQRLQRPEVPADADSLQIDLQRLQQSLRERLTASDWETLARWNTAIVDRVLTPEVIARIEVALERINRG